MKTKFNLYKAVVTSYLKRILRIGKNPVFASLFFTRNCNMNCAYCKTARIPAQKTDIPVEDWYNIIDIIYKWGLRHLTIYGGEPTLRADLPDLLKYCVKKSILTHIVTNGSLLDEDILSDLINGSYLLLGISIDNLIPTQSSKKVYNENLITILREFKQKFPDKVDYCINIILTKENIHNFIPTITTIQKNLQTSFSVDPVHSAIHPNQQYLYRDYCPHLTLSVSELKWLAKAISQLKRHKYRIWGSQRYYNALIDWFSGKYTWKCDVGDLYFSINNDGTLMVCEETLTPYKVWDLEDASYKERKTKISKFKLPYCQCVKPCYFMPSDLVRHPIRQFL